KYLKGKLPKTQEFILGCISLVVSPIRLGLVARSMEYLFTKCITTLPVSYHYGWLSLPTIGLLVVAMMTEMNSYPMELSARLLYITEALSTISSVAFLILSRSVAMTNPI